eukprot:COSAG02_NODE_4175_length_5668_cov_3.592386_1_plen_50_part_10
MGHDHLHHDGLTEQGGEPLPKVVSSTHALRHEDHDEGIDEHPTPFHSHDT